MAERVPDPFVNTRRIILEMCCVGERPFGLSAEANEAWERMGRWYVAHILCPALIYYLFLFFTKKMRGPERG